MRAFYITFPYKFIYSRAVPVSESHIIVFAWTSQWNADRIFARKNSKRIYPNKWLKFCKSVEDKVPLFEEEDTISAEMGWNTKQEFGYKSLWICGSIYQKINFHEYSRKVFAKLETWIWLLESTTWLSVFVFIFFGGSEYQNQPDYFHCSGERMKQQHQQSLYCNSSVEIQITKNLQFMKTPILHFNIY